MTQWAAVKHLGRKSEEGELAGGETEFAHFCVKRCQSLPLVLWCFGAPGLTPMEEVYMKPDHSS